MLGLPEHEGKLCWVCNTIFFVLGFLAACVLFQIVGCSKPAPLPAPAPIPPPPPGVTISGPVSDQYISFEITYTYHLTQGRTLKMTAKSNPWLDHSTEDRDDNLLIDFQDSMEQPNGNWVIFDCDNIADKIIDAALVIEIRPYCTAGHQMALDYWHKHDYVPDEFTDSTGKHWKRTN